MSSKILLMASGRPQRRLGAPDGTPPSGAGAPPFAIVEGGTGPARAYAAIAVLAPAFFFLYGLDAFPLRDMNEGLYAGIARAMLDSGQYVVPQLNGVPYLEKPPLQYWVMSLSMALFGATPAAARLGGAAGMVALCLCLFQFCRLHGNPRAGCYASVGLASMVPVALLSHVVLFDPLLTALLGACLLCYLHGYLARSRRAHLLAAVLLALAVLEKGGVALVLAGGVAGLFLLQMRDRDGWRRLFDPAALALLVAVAAPWHVLAALAQEGFSWFYFINEHVLRFLGLRLPADYHRGPIWFYLPRLLVLPLPWTPFLLLLAPAPGGPAPASSGALVAFCKAGVLFPFVFFSLSQAKADYYLLAAMPALALWLALDTTRRLGSAGDRRLARCWGMAAASALVLLAAAPGAVGYTWRVGPVLLLALGWGVVAWAATRLFLQLRSVAAREAAMLAVVLAAAPALAVLCHEAGAQGPRYSSRDIVRIILEPPQPSMRAVFIYRDFEDVFSTLPFYLGRPVPVIDSTSRDLQFGCSVAPRSSCITAGQFQRLRQRGPVAVAVQQGRAAEFLKMAGPGRWRVVRAAEKMVFFNTE
jgi:4-amino-4-deoxy-L-arabinose transferase-like glycosyltransferase